MGDASEGLRLSKCELNMNCTICGKPVILVPSAAERAAKYGESPMYYTRLFPQHTDCFLQRRKEETSALTARLRAMPGMPVVSTFFVEPRPRS